LVKLHSYVVFQCGIDFFKKEGGVYKKMSFAVAPDSCCQIINNEKFKQAMEKQNVPKECPIKVVSIVTQTLSIMFRD
jgi:hypothetical protein